MRPKALPRRTEPASMKFLFDIFPVILFFAAFKGAEHFPTEAIDLA